MSALYNWILEDLYPKLDEAWRVIGDEQHANDNPSVTPEQQARIRHAVTEERLRIQATQVTEPDTLLGNDLKRDLDMPTSIVNKIVRKGLRRRLKNFSPRGKN